MVSLVSRNIFQVFAKLNLGVVADDISRICVIKAKASFGYGSTLQLDQTSLNSMKTSILGESQHHNNGSANPFVITPDVLQLELSPSILTV